jgi:hypothetical protein
MKLKLFILFVPALLIFSSAAHAQSAGSISSQPVVVEFPDHVQHADVHEMATERPLVGQGPNTYTYAQGEQPLWEFGHPSEMMPLGDIARAYRQQKLTAKKADIVFEQVGSKNDTDRVANQTP